MRSGVVVLFLSNVWPALKEPLEGSLKPEATLVVALRLTNCAVDVAIHANDVLDAMFGIGTHVESAEQPLYPEMVDVEYSN